MSTTVLYRDEQAGKKVKTISAATTLTQSDSGKLLVLNAAAGAAVTLPSPVAGFNCRVYVGATFATTAWTIVGDSNIYGSALVNGASVVADDETTITLSASAETIGDTPPDRVTRAG